MNPRDFIPPILLQWMKKINSLNNKLFNSYESATAECKSGYEKDSLVTVVCEKTKIYRDILISEGPPSDISSLRTFIGLSLSLNSGKNLNVIDFGGACGAHYFLAKSLLRDRIRLHWHVVETPSMAKSAVSLENEELKFYNDLDKAKNELGRVDMVFTSYALPYLPNPYESLKSLVKCGASNILITRMPLSTLSHELITIQTSKLSSNGPGPMPSGMKDGIIQFPITFVRKDKFESIIAKDYQVQIRFTEDKGAYAVGKYSIDMYGYFCSSKKK